MGKIIVVVILAFVLVGKCYGHCEDGESNYTSVQHKAFYKEVYTTIYKTTYYKTCSWWIIGCKKKSRAKAVKTKKAVKYYEGHTVTKCCPGFTNISSICTEGCEKGMYGENCTMNCSWCKSYCMKDSGDCICQPGETGDNCTEVCPEGKYGTNCSQTCMCQNNSTCNAFDGSCNCTSPGWHGTLCDNECTNNTYGLRCNETCMCNDNQTCNHVDGSCLCKSGWHGENCSEECDAMKFGVDCRENCTCDRKNTDTCDKETGHCYCNPGYTDLDCAMKCEQGTFGQNCSRNCDCMFTDFCDHINGSCLCPGMRGRNCSQECEPGTFGPNCVFPCNCTNSLSNETCNNFTGQCTCLPGWIGRTCDTGCDPGTYGPNCIRPCNCTHSINVSCDNLTGQCTCMPGWAGRACDTEVNNNSMEAKSLSKKEGFIKENLLYLVVGLVGLFILTTVTVTAVCIRRKNLCSSAFRSKAKRTSVISNSQENPNYNTSLKDTIPISNISNEKMQSYYEEAVFDKKDDTEETDDAKDKLSHNRNSELPKTDKDKNCEDDYCVPDDEQQTKHTKTSHPTEEVYDSTQGDVAMSKDVPNEYNTFKDILKIQQENRNLKNDSEEDYDVITHAGHTVSKKAEAKDLEHYSSFEQVRKFSLQNSGDEEEDTYNELNDHLQDHKSAVINDSRYHHISLKDKTVDGERFDKTNTSGRISSISSQRTSKTSNKLTRQKSLETEVINEELEEGSENNIDRANADDLMDEEVIYDECDIDDIDNDKEPNSDKTEGHKTVPVVSDRNNAAVNEVVYEEFDENDEQVSAAVYEDVDSESNKSESSEEEEADTKDKSEHDSDQGQEKPLIKRTKERRREDYEEFAL